MTPHVHRVAQAGQTALAVVNFLTVTVDAAFRLLRFGQE
jgi:hypothetical protein